MNATLNEHDGERSLVAAVESAREVGSTLTIRGGGTKGFLGNLVETDRELDCSVHRGLIAYEPTELVVSARAGTSLAAVEALLAEHDQAFPFEPPHFGAGATIGGMVAAGLSGPRRPYAASVRDAVLGVRLLNGKGQALNFGGRVMKNVAGYDLSRLMAGSLGTLGVLLECSLKVVPRPPLKITLVREERLESALSLLVGWSRRALPLSASVWLDGRLYLRLEGSDEALVETRRIVGGEPLGDRDGFWDDLREQRLDFFAGDDPLWRLSVQPATKVGRTPGVGLVEWGGAQRWLRTEGPSDAIRTMAAEAGGHATLFRRGRRAPLEDGVFAPLDPVNRRLHQTLKRASDPDGLFNPGRLYPWM